VAQGTMRTSVFLSGHQYFV